jgi:ferric-dicitrate binding protein FerR (iron transport regulator)
MSINKSHFEKFLGPKSTLQDWRKVEEYFSDEKLNQEARLILKDQWDRFEPDQANRPNLDSVFYKLYYEISKPENSGRKNRKIYFRLSNVAAILIAAVLIASGIYFSGNDFRNTENQSIEFVSATGFRNQFKLPDGTTGWLGYGSKLNYHSDSKNHRVAELNGIAYFNVAHRPNQPFVVKTPANLNIEVHGTKFNVTSYENSNTCEVILENGSVVLTDKNGLTEKMTPNDRVIYHVTDHKLVKSEVNPADFLAWIDGKLVLKDISFQEACFKLSKFYNVDIEIKSPEVCNEPVRLILEDETLDEALNLLSILVPIKYRVEERKALEDNSYSKRKITINKRSPMQ